MGNTIETRAELSSISDELTALAVRAEELLAEAAALVDGDAPVSVDDARALCVAAGRAEHAVTNLAVVGVGVADRARVHRVDGERTTRRWLARHLGVSVREASRWCRAAVTVERFPRVVDDLVDGEIAPGHLDAIATMIPLSFRGEQLDAAVQLVDELLPMLLDHARTTTVEEFERVCAHVRDVLESDGRPDRGAEPSRVWLSKTFDGRWALSGDLNADDGALAATMLDDVRARLRATRRNQPDAAQSADTSKPVASERTAEALMRLLFDGAGATRPGRAAVYLHIDLDTLHGVPDTAHTEANLDITDDTFWALLEDADVTPVFNESGLPLCYGRTRRIPPPVLRRAIAHRDRRCRFPGCDATAVNTQTHHLVFFDDGGDTSPTNGAMLCAFHHHLIHDDGWTITGRPPNLVVRQPDGTIHTADPAWRHRQRERHRHHKATIVTRLEHERARRAA